MSESDSKEKCSEATISQCMLRCLDGDNSSTHRAVALFLLILCCSCGTPVTLICTVPGYILADVGAEYTRQGFIKRGRKCILASILLNTIGTILGLVIAAGLLYIIVTYV